MAKQVSISGYKYYAIYLAIAKSPSSRMDFSDILPAAKQIYPSMDLKTLKADLPGMFQNALEHNDRLKLYVKGNNVQNTRAIQSACANRVDGKYQFKSLSPTLWEVSTWSVVPFDDVPSNNLVGRSELTHGVRHQSRGVKPFKSYRAKLDQKLSDHKDDLNHAKNRFAGTSEKTKVRIDKASSKFKEQADELYKRLRGTSMRFRNRFLKR